MVFRFFMSDRFVLNSRLDKAKYEFNLNLSGASLLRYMGQGVIAEIETSGTSSVIHL